MLGVCIFSFILFAFLKLFLDDDFLDLTIGNIFLFLGIFWYMSLWYALYGLSLVALAQYSSGSMCRHFNPSEGNYQFASTMYMMFRI